MNRRRTLTAALVPARGRETGALRIGVSADGGPPLSFSVLPEPAQPARKGRRS
ncbi:hypothetical protein [Streptomyces decoyicus]|uniref:hypothetical protein n=1 Tax=Streptomyces decoyicus TaxID=249567 RepID=UPI0033BA7831